MLILNTIQDKTINFREIDTTNQSFNPNLPKLNLNNLRFVLHFVLNKIFHLVFAPNCVLR